MWTCHEKPLFLILEIIAWNSGWIALCSVENLTVRGGYDKLWLLALCVFEC